jgi:hypothetical protein
VVEVFRHSFGIETKGSGVGHPLLSTGDDVECLGCDILEDVAREYALYYFLAHDRDVYLGEKVHHRDFGALQGGRPVVCTALWPAVLILLPCLLKMVDL